MKTQHDKMHPAICLFNKIKPYRREGIPPLNSAPVHRQAKEVPSLTADSFKSLGNSDETGAIHIDSFRH